MKKGYVTFFGIFILVNILFVNLNATIADLFNDETLIISNFPETIHSPGLIFEKEIEKSSMRIMYHHKNSNSKTLTLIVSISNKSDESIKFDLQYGLGGSSKDVVFAGHKSAKSFMQQLLLKPHQMTLPAKSTAVIVKHAIKSNEVSSGHIRISSFKHNNLSVKMGVIDEEYPQLSLFKDVPSLANQFKVIQADKSKIDINKSFDCEDKIDAIEIGGKPYIKDITNKYAFMGNYAVMYAVNLTLTNSLFKSNEIKLFFSPKKENAIDRGVIILNNEVKEIGMLTNKQNIITMENFFSTVLKPSETKNVSFLLFPQAGCYYPIDIIIKSDERLL